MAFLRDQATRKSLYEELGKGNETAKYILSNLSSMTQEDLNNALAAFTPSPVDVNEVWEELIADEYEAINGYNNAINILKGMNTPEAEYKIGILEHIREEELEHITELKNAQFNPENIETEGETVE